MRPRSCRSNERSQAKRTEGKKGLQGAEKEGAHINYPPSTIITIAIKQSVLGHDISAVFVFASTYLRATDHFQRS